MIIRYPFTKKPHAPKPLRWIQQAGKPVRQCFPWALCFALYTKVPEACREDDMRTKRGVFTDELRCNRMWQERRSWELMAEHKCQRELMSLELKCQSQKYQLPFIYHLYVSIQSVSLFNAKINQISSPFMGTLQMSPRKGHYQKNRTALEQQDPKKKHRKEPQQRNGNTDYDEASGAGAAMALFHESWIAFQYWTACARMCPTCPLPSNISRSICQPNFAASAA